MFIYKIVKDVQESFRGLCERLEEKTRKSKQGWAAHGYEPKSINPLAHGAPSPADHYVEFVELYENTMPGAGAMLNEKIYFENRRRLRQSECEGDVYDCLIKHINVSKELNEELVDGLRDGKLDRAEIRKIRNKLPEISAVVEKAYAMLDFHESLIESKTALPTFTSNKKVHTNGAGKRARV